MLVLQEYCFHSVCLYHNWHAPTMVYDNTPMVSFTFHDSSTVNPVVGYLLCLRLIWNRDATISNSIFYHLSSENIMADEASHRFRLSDLGFIPFFTARYSLVQPTGYCTTFHPPIESVSSVISVMRRQMSEMEMSPISGQ